MQIWNENDVILIKEQIKNQMKVAYLPIALLSVVESMKYCHSEVLTNLHWNMAKWSD